MKRWLKVYVKVVKNFLSEKKIDEADMEEKFPFRDLVDDEISDDDSSDAEGEGKGEGEGEGEGSDEEDEGEIETQETQDTVGTLETQEIFGTQETQDIFGTQETQDIFGTQETQAQVAPGLTMMQRGGGRGDGEGEREGLHGVRSRHSDAGSRQSTDENESVGRTSGYKRRKIS